MAHVTYNPAPQYRQKDETDEALFAPCTVYGITFKPGEAVEVADDLNVGDAKLNVVDKLRNNPQFTVEDKRGRPAAHKPVEPAPKADA